MGELIHTTERTEKEKFWGTWEREVGTLVIHFVLRLGA